MTSPEAATPSPEPSDSNSSSASPPEPTDSPSTQPSEPSGTATPPPSDPPASSTPTPSAEPPASSGIIGWIKSNMLIVGGVAGVVVIVVIIAILLGTGAIGGGGGGPSEVQEYVLDDTAAAVVVEVAAIMEAPAIPAQLAGFSSVGFPNLDPEDLTAWIEAWEAEWADDFPRIWGSIGLEDITTALLQEDADGRDLGWIFFGEFAFADVRESLEDAGRKSDTYRDFEVWGDDVALLEDRGAILIGTFVQDVLKALDTERGFADDTNVLRQALGKAGAGLALSVKTDCSSGSFFQASPNGCESVLEVVASGDAENTIVTGTYVFGSASRAESGLEDIEDAIEMQDTYDADLNQIQADGEFVSYEVSMVGEFVGGTAAGIGGASGPLSYALEDINYLGMLNVAAILESSEIPAQLVNSGPVSLPSDGIDEPEEWKETWRDEWDGWFFGLVGEALSLDDITSIVYQRTEDGELGVLLFGNFEFDDVREFLEDEDREQDAYRDFEIWDDEFALLEDRGLIALNNEEFVKDLLKALDTGEGFLDDTGELKAGLGKAGEGLSLVGSTSCANTLFRTSPRSCEAVVEVIKSGDSDTTDMAAVYVFSSERRAESGMEDLQEAIEDQEVYDADIEKIEAEGEFVSYEVTIHE